MKKGFWSTLTSKLSGQLSPVDAELVARYAAIVESSDDAIISQDLSGIINAWNPAAERLFGYAAAEAVGQTLDHLIVPPDRHAEAATVLERLRRGEMVNNLATRRHHRDGRLLDVLNSTAPIRDAAGRVIGGVTTLRDITERKRSEFALMESETHFRGMMDSMPAMVWLMGPDQQVYFFNKTALEFRGRTLEQELGIGWTEGLHPDDHARTWSLFAEAFAARAPFSLDIRLRRHDGAYRWIQDVGLPRWDAAGQFIGYIGSCVDIEDRKQAEQQVLELNDSLERKVAERTSQLEAANAAKTRFLAHMSHELRTPMNAILGFAQVLEHDRLTPDQHEMISMIREAGAHLMDIIGDILDLSKIEAGKLRRSSTPLPSRRYSNAWAE